MLAEPKMCWRCANEYPADGACYQCDGPEELAGPVIRASGISAEKVDWLWPARVPLGMVTVVGGFPGVGKSTILYDRAAHTSKAGRAVIIATAEDHLAAVVRPRLEAAGADLDLVWLVTAAITLPESVGLLRGLVEEHEAALFILDPLVAFIGDGINTHRDHHVRRVLAPLASLAEATQAAVMVVIHTNKGEGLDPLMRISGSVGFTGAARSVLLAADDPENEDRRILAVIKSNLAEKPPPLAYTLTSAALGNGIVTSKVDWLGEAPEVDVPALLAALKPSERTELREAVELLWNLKLTDKAMSVAAVEKEADALGIHPKALQRARRRLGLPTWKQGCPGVWMWGSSDLDTRTGHPNHPGMSNSVRPAEMYPNGPDLDNLVRLGEQDPQSFLEDWNRRARERARERL